MSQRYPVRRSFEAFTLLEVIIALAILAGAVALLSQVSGSASRNANHARAETQAQLLAHSILNEMLVGLIQASDVSRQPVELEEGLNSIEITVEQDLEEQFNPVKYQLFRWIPTDLPSTASEDQESESSDEDSAPGEENNA